MSLERRKFLATAAAALAGAAANPRFLFAQHEQAPPQTAFTPVRRSVGIFTGQGGTIGWHVDKKGVVVVDSQFPATAQVCLDGLRQRAPGRTFDFLVNSHHHGDHTAGNGVFQPAVRKILAHVNVPKLQKEAAERAAASAKPGQEQAPQVHATATYEKVWHEQVGDEGMDVRYYGPAHTSGDSVITFEKANVVHMGDLVFNRRHPYIDRPAGASIANWMKVLDEVASAHERDTIYIFGHAASPGFRETGSRADLAYMRDYLSALLEFVRAEMKAGKPREAIVKITDPLPKFPDHGPLIERVLGAAYDELAG
jgi:glyoxylase-like metal-dependent hydrolase (beta-lactamase superfamily II)